VPHRRIFISYRHDDGQKDATRIRQCLENEFGAGSVFMDKYDIRPGVEFETHLKTEVSTCEIVIVVIGAKWLKILKEKRTKNLHDYVRLEVSRALKQSALVIPILLGKSKIPDREYLPTNLKKLSIRNGLTLTVSDDSGLAKLIDAVRERFENPAALFDRGRLSEAFERQELVFLVKENKEQLQESSPAFQGSTV
jgi:hypothetical protein